MKTYVDQLFDILAKDVVEGRHVFAGISSLPFWIRKELVRFRKTNGYSSSGWTMEEPLRTEIEVKIEQYFRLAYPKAQSIGFGANSEDATEMQNMLEKYGKK